MRTSWGKLVQHVGTKYSQDIRNELNKNIKVNILTPVHLTEVLVRHFKREALVHTGQSIIQASRWAHANILLSAATAGPSYTEIPKTVATMDNEITKGDYNLAKKISIEMPESDKTAYVNDRHTSQNTNSNLENHRVQAYSLILGICTHLLQDKMKQDTALNSISTYYNPLVLLQLI